MQSLQEYAGAPHNKGTLALVFTDIVGSTELNNHFGDDEWLSILFPRQTVWLVLTEEMRHAEHERWMARREAGVPQSHRPIFSVQPPSNQPSAQLAPQTSEELLRRYKVRPRKQSPDKR